MTDLQMLSFYALEDMTLTELNKRYFGGGGIGWTKRLLSGVMKPHELAQQAYCKGFDQKYQDMLAEHKRYVEESKKRGGWA